MIRNLIKLLTGRAEPAKEVHTFNISTPQRGHQLAVIIRCDEDGNIDVDAEEGPISYGA